MIILLILLVIFASVFCVVEIYSEAITVVQLGSDVVNYTINHRPELINMFPEGEFLVNLHFVLLFSELLELKWRKLICRENIFREC